MIYRIDAENKILGRLASEVAVLLRGKNKPDFAANKLADHRVEISNVAKIQLTGKKASKKFYFRYSGYPGGITKISYKSLSMKNPAAVLRKAVYGMLPKNRLRAKLLRRLIIK